MIYLTMIRTFGFRLRTLGVIGLVCLIGLAPPVLFAQQTQSELQASLAMHEDEILQQEDGAVAEELKQTMELYLMDVSIEQALKEIAEKTDLKLMYHKALLSQEKKVTLTNPKITLYDALWQVLEGTGIRFGLSQNRQLVLLKMQEPEPIKIVQETITGSVTDAQSGEALPAVNVSVKGTGIGTSTNEEGRYELTNVPSLQDTLIFSFIGYQTREIPIGGRTTINVELTSQTVEGEEVVVTAFGMEREQRSLGYSTQNVQSEALTEARESNILSNLRGRISGVEINQSPATGGSTGMIIRGVGSLTGNNQPLIVVDGVPIDNQQLQAPAAGGGGIDYGDGIAGLNPDDIEDLQVLKGPNAAALYGSRGANGVILITSKTGYERGGIGVTYKSNVTFDQIGMKPKFQNKYAPGYGLNWEDAYGTIVVDGQEVPNYTGGIDNHGPRLDGRMIYLEHFPEMGLVSATPQPSDNIFDFYNTGITANNTLSFAGGNARTTYRVSVGDTRNEGVVPNSKYSSNSVSLHVSTNITDNLSVKGRANYLRHEGNNRPALGGNFENTFLNLVLQPRFIDLEWYKDYKRPDGTPVNASARYPQNPYWVVNEINNEDERDRIYGFISADYAFTEWLELQVRAGTDTYQDQRFRRAPINTATDLTGRVENHSYKVQENNYDFLLSAENDLSPDFTGSLRVGGNYMFRKTEHTGLVGTNLNIRNLFHISNANSVNPQYYISRKEIQSVYALGQLGFRDYLFLDLTARNDWSSTLGIGNESFFYPSASVSFVFTDVLDINSDILTFGKLRASYAESGNDASPYQTQAGFNISGLDYQGVRMATVPNQIPLVDLENELTKSWEFGTDIRLFNNRLGIDFTTYMSSTLNQIFPVSVSNTTGYSSRLINAGQVDNRGIELSINATVAQTTDFRWDLGFNASRNRSEVIELASGVDTYDIYNHADFTLQARPGEPYGDIEAYVTEKTEEGRLILNQDGGLQRAPEREVIGNMQPDFLGGITSEIYYKGFSLGGVFDYRIGGDMISFTKREGYMKGTGIHTNERSEEMYFDGVIRNLDSDGEWDGTYRENDVPVDPVDFYPTRVWSQLAEFYMVDGTYLSLNELTLGYTFPTSFLTQIPLTSLKLSVVGRNLAYLYLDEDLREMGVPPTSSNSRDPASLAIEENNFPLTRTIGFNVSAEF